MHGVVLIYGLSLIFIGYGEDICKSHSKTQQHPLVFKKYIMPMLTIVTSFFKLNYGAHVCKLCIYHSQKARDMTAIRRNGGAQARKNKSRYPLIFSKYSSLFNETGCVICINTELVTTC